MPDKRGRSTRPVTHTLASTSPHRWHEDSDEVQDARWWLLTDSATEVCIGEEWHTVGPFLPAGGVEQYRLVQLRCGHEACRAVIGEVWAVDAEWRGSAFVWTELARVIDPAARPPLVAALHVVLDDFVSSHDLRAECLRHGKRTLPASAVRGVLGGAVERFRARGTSITLTMSDGAP